MNDLEEWRNHIFSNAFSDEEIWNGMSDDRDVKGTTIKHEWPWYRHRSITLR